MATLTIRNIPPKIIDALKSMATHNNRSIEQEVLKLLEDYALDRKSVIEQVKAGWKQQRRPTTAREIDSWIREGRE